MKSETIYQFIDNYTNEKKDACIKVYATYFDKFISEPASSIYHHNWDGGLYDHIFQVMKIGIMEFGILLKQEIISEDFGAESIIVISLIHDLEKIKRYKKNKNFNSNKQESKNNRPYEFVFQKYPASENLVSLSLAMKCGLILNERELSALDMIEGAYSSILKEKPFLSPGRLATLCHLADFKSAKFFANVIEEKSRELAIKEYEELNLKQYIIK